MANQAISQLPVSIALDGTELVPLVQQGSTKRTTTGDIATLAQTSALPSLSFTAPLSRSVNTVSLSGWTATVNNGVLYRPSSLAVTSTAAGLVGQLLTGNGASAAPSWLAAGSTGQVLLGSTSASAVWLSAGVAGQLLVSNTTAQVSWLAAGVSGQVLVARTSAVPIWTNISALPIDLDVGSSTITGGTSGRVLYDNAGILGEMLTTGTGTTLALQTSAQLVTPNIGVATGTSLNLGSGTLTAGLISAPTDLTLAAAGANVAMLSATAYRPVADLGASLGTSSTRWSDIRSNTGTFNSTTNFIGGTLTASVPGINVTQTWNNASSTFDAIYANVTDTAHSDGGNGSNILSLQVASGNRFRVDVYGQGFFNSDMWCGGAAHVNTGTAIPAGGTAGQGLNLSTTSNLGLFFGSGAPTLQAAAGSIYLRSNGGISAPVYANISGAVAWTQLLTKGGLKIIQSAFTASSTWTPNTNLIYGVIEGVGGGGAGGGNGGGSSTSIGSGGGGSGSYSRALVASTVTAMAVTLGAGGTGVSGAAGNSGGTTSVGVVLTAPGGSGGGTGNTAGGSGGVLGTSGIAVGNGGAPGSGGPSANVNAFGGSGGPSYFGGGGQVQVSTSGAVTGNVGTTGGGGGGGCVVGVANCTGGAGGTGYVLVTEFCSG